MSWPACCLRTDRFAADRAGRPHRVSGLLHPCRRPQAGQDRRDQTQHPGRADRPGNQPGFGQDE
jgi:hypothetical protein